MPRVHKVKSARKNYPQWGIEKGDSYYWWKFNYGAMVKSLTPPKPQQLTQSPFLQELYSIQDNIAAFAPEFDSIADEFSEILDQITALREQCEESLENMPEHLQETSDSGMMLTERIEGLEMWHDELEGIDMEIDDSVSDEIKQERLEEIIEEIQTTDYSI